MLQVPRPGPSGTEYTLTEQAKCVHGRAASEPCGQCPTTGANTGAPPDELFRLRLKVRDADKMAMAIDHQVKLGQLDSRSAIAGARLDYGKPYEYEPMPKQGISRTTACKVCGANPCSKYCVVQTYPNSTPGPGPGQAPEQSAARPEAQPPQVQPACAWCEFLADTEEELMAHARKEHPKVLVRPTPPAPAAPCYFQLDGTTIVGSVDDIAEVKALVGIVKQLAEALRELLDSNSPRYPLELVMKAEAALKKVGL
jgi:hypothetical protein